MKLRPMARPVQINKLRLGGKDINTKDDLLRNFCVTEILALGNKFTQWLYRHDDVIQYATSVSTIIVGNDTKEKKAIDLLCLFFPEYKGQTLDSVLCSWLDNGTSNMVLASLLKCINPSASLAVSLLQKGSQDNTWLIDWLKDCETKVELTGDFCYEYGAFLKKIRSKDADNWLDIAIRKGNKKAKSLRNNVIKIEVRSSSFTMIRVNDDFYIANTPLTGDIYVACDVLNTNDVGEKEIEKDVCDKILRKLKVKTNYTWELPTKEQLELANKNNVITLEETKMEWCKDLKVPYNFKCKEKERYKINKDDGITDIGWKTILSIADKTDQLSSVKALVRPVLNISQNPKLQ